MRNRIERLVEDLGITPYRLAKDTGISKNTVYLLISNPSQFPKGEVFEKIIESYRVTPNDIVEWYEL
jgi:DNA-binding Xre family transcriptional regulator